MTTLIFTDPAEKSLILDALQEYWLSCIWKLQINNLGHIESRIVEETKIRLHDLINKINEIKPI